MSELEALDRVLEWCRLNAPVTLATLQPPASARDVARAEELGGVEWSVELRELYRTVNGQTWAPTSLLPENNLYSLEELEDERTRSVALREWKRSDRSGMKLYSGFTRDEMEDYVGQRPSSYDPRTGIVEDLSDEQWLGIPPGSSPEGAERIRLEVFEREFERVGQMFVRLGRKPGAERRPGLGKAGSPSMWWKKPFIPFAGVDGYFLVVDLRPGSRHGCVCAWDNVEGLGSPLWASLSDMFESLYTALTEGERFSYYRATITDGAVVWEFADDDENGDGN